MDVAKKIPRYGVDMHVARVCMFVYFIEQKQLKQKVSKEAVKFLLFLVFLDIKSTKV